MVVTRIIGISTRGQNDTHDLTAAVSSAVAACALQRGVVIVFVVGSTAGITTIEFEPGAVSDFNGLMEELAPRNADYDHHARWGDDNGSSHVRAALVGPSLAVPFNESRLVLGTWQQIVLVEFDTRPRAREIVLQIVLQNLAWPRSSLLPRCSPPRPCPVSPQLFDAA